MDELNERLANLGRAVAEVNGADHDATADARRRWARSSQRPRGRRWTFVVAPAFAIAAAVIAIIATRAPDDRHAPSYTVGDAPGELGQWIAARDPVRLQFADGSRIEIARDAKVRVAATDRHGSTLDVEQGALHADVARRDTSAWRFRTGPYTVLVKGTRFDAAWDSTTERFTLDMVEGKVEVTGPLIPAPITVSAGQSVLASVREKRFEIRSGRTADATHGSKTDADARQPDVGQPVPPSTSSSIDPVAQPQKKVEGSTLPTTTRATLPAANKSRSTPNESAPQVTGTPQSRSMTAQPGTSRTGESTRSATSATSTTAEATPAKTEKWRQYLAARAYSSAITAAEQRGFETVAAEATSEELYALSDAARYAGRLARARDALIAVRARFGEQGKTAYLLGRIAADQGDDDAAIEWFDRYLREQPGGALAETATGRLIELYRAHDASRARMLAERYLAAYPAGSYAALARTLTEK